MKMPEVYEIQERAAILEYDAGMSREDAERRALELAGLRAPRPVKQKPPPGGAGE